MNKRQLNSLVEWENWSIEEFGFRLERKPIVFPCIVLWLQYDDIDYDYVYLEDFNKTST